MDWKVITDDLYKKIDPVRGDLSTRIDSRYPTDKTISTIWVEFDMNEFTYLDPFYGEQKSTEPFRMFVNPFETEKPMEEIRSLYELEDKVIEDTPTNTKGAFSNSLHFSAPYIQFYKIKQRRIGFKMEYCLTNSESYPMMTGAIKDHIQAKGTINLELQIKELLIVVPKQKNVWDIVNHLDTNIYDLDSTHLAIDTGVTYGDYNEFRVAYRDNSLI
jgi:hypothetical protein